MSITAEGIETAEQSAMLLNWKCDRGQGYYFARPLDAEAFSSLLRTRDSSHLPSGEGPGDDMPAPPVGRRRVA